MNNKMCFRFVSLLLAAGLMVSCMGLKDTTPMIGTPQVLSFTIVNTSEFVYELTATYSKKDISIIADGGFYVSSYKSMQNAIKVECLRQGRTFVSEISLEAEGQKVYVCAYINSGHYEICSEIRTVIAGETKHSLSAANCHIVSEAGSYDFPAFKGNGMESVGVVKSVDVLWESFGTSTTPKVGDLIKSVSYKDGNVIFSTADTFREGNAVIAARDASGTILWSWHIWLTDKPQGQEYYNNAGTMMDRNLGATSATPGDVGALGLLYQWGRKDPFLGSSSIDDEIDAKSTITWPSAVYSDSSYGTIEYVTANPLTFVEGNAYNKDWYSYDTISYPPTTDNTRWQSKKTIYDPCPAGWRVPDGGDNGVWSKALGSRSDFSANFGADQTIWYPASGYRYYSAGSLSNVGSFGHSWSVTPYGYYAYFLSVNTYGYVNPTNINYRAYGNAVRCLQE